MTGTWATVWPPVWPPAWLPFARLAAIWLAAMLCVGLMGFAMQRGATCTVAAVEELLNERRAWRLAAMLEASLWVAGGLALAQLAGLQGSMPAGHGASVWTVIGGTLLGLGAWLNGACVFGAVARLGAGQWAYAATPLGFYLGCLSVMPVFSRPAAGVPGLPPVPSMLPGGPALLALCFVLFVLWRAGPGLRAMRAPGRVRWRGRTVWAPHAATVVIGVSFVLTLLLAGRWAYTDVLADLARAMAGGPAALALPLLLLVALYAGALLGGHAAGLWRSTRVSARQLARCVAGGMVMGWGSLLIPGSNDGLVLIGLPLLQPHAWLAFVTMLATVAAAMLASRGWRARSAAAASARTKSLPAR